MMAEAKARLTRLLLLALFAAAGAMLQACSTVPSGLLTPMPPAEDARTVEMLVFSTRARAADPGMVFSGERGGDVGTLVAEVSIPPNHQTGRVEWPRKRIPNPEEEFAATRIEWVNESAALDWLEAQEHDGHVLIFVHGFNAPFDRTVFSLAQLITDSGIDAAPVLFTWPSRGRLWAYVYDRESANYSRDALEQVLRTSARHPHVREITLMAHSMGSWIAVEALRQYAIRDGAVDSKIRNVVLAAPDLDIDVFTQQFLALGEERPHFTFLVAQDDQALRTSRLIAGGVQRVGALDPSAPDVRSALEVAGGITIIDMTQIRGGDRMHHSVFASSPEIVRLLGGNLASIQNLSGAVQMPLGSLVLNVGETLTSSFSPPQPAYRTRPQPHPDAPAPDGPEDAQDEGAPDTLVTPPNEPVALTH